jgi:MFS family permease
MDRRILLFVTETGALLVSLALGLMVVLGMQSLWLIFFLIFITSILSSIDAPIRQALIPELVPQKHIPNAVALTTAAYWGSYAVTPILAGFVIDGIGPGGAYLVSTLGNVGILVALALLKYRGAPRQARHESTWQTIRFGFSHARHQPVILWILLLTFVSSAFCFALFHGVIAKWAGNILGLGPGQYGILAATWGVGTLLASYTLSYLGEIRHHGRILLISSLLFALSFLVFGLTRSLPLAGIAYLINGAAWICASISSTAIVQRITPNEVRGRVMSLFMLSGAVAQMNSLTLGLIADWVGLALLVPLTSALCTILVLVLIIVVPTLRRLDQLTS